MRSVEDESIDLVVTSPPYPMIEMWDEQFKSVNPEISKAMDTQNGNLVFQLMHQTMNKTWEQICRVMKPGGIVCINIGDATRKFNDQFRLFPNHMMIMNFFNSAGYSSLPLILWRKQTNKPNKFMGSGMLPPGAYVTLEHEYILIFRKGNKRHFNDKEKQNRRKSSYFWHERNKWFSDVWLDLKGDRQILKKNGSRDRSGSYPFELVYRLINMFSVRGDVVLDPYLGTGTTMLAAMILNRNSIGFEIEKGFKELINDKLSTVKENAENIIRSRLEDHLNFVIDRLGNNKNFKHFSVKYGLPVISNQSKEMELLLVDKFILNEEGVSVFYKDILEDPILAAWIRKFNRTENYERKALKVSEISEKSLDDWY